MTRSFASALGTTMLCLVFAAVGLAGETADQGKNAAGAKDEVVARASGPSVVPGPSVTPGPERRNPFSPPKNKEPVEEEKELVFGDPGSGWDRLRGKNIPQIRVKGVMLVNNKIAACAEVANKGVAILRENERILFSGAGGEASTGFRVIRLSKNGMTIQLDDGTLVSGRFF